MDWDAEDDSEEPVHQVQLKLVDGDKERKYKAERVIELITHIRARAPMLS